MSECHLQYQCLPEWTREEMESVIRGGNLEELMLVPLVAGMYPPDCEWAKSICIKLASHFDPAVKANAIMGLGHLARTCGELPESIVRPIIESGLCDSNRWISQQSHAAADEIVHYLGWNLDTQ